MPCRAERKSTSITCSHCFGRLYQQDPAHSEHPVQGITNVPELPLSLLDLLSAHTLDIDHEHLYSPA